METNLEKMDDFFNQRAYSYDAHMIDDLGLTEFYDEIQKLLPCSNSKMSFLDLGCGTGLEIERILSNVPNAEITGIDLSIEMLEILKQKFNGMINQLNIICGSYFDVDFIIAKYDYIANSIEDEQFYLAENKRRRSENEIKDGFYHYDTPLFFKTEEKLLREAGFKNVTIAKKWENSIIFLCSK